VELFRSVPLLVLLLWVFYGLPVIIGLQLSVFATGVLSLALSDSAFEAEVFRAGIQSVPKGQIEAAKSLGLSWAQRMRLVVMPQAIKVSRSSRAKSNGSAALSVASSACRSRTRRAIRSAR
jgi:polar amino acid transport system permease protein